METRELKDCTESQLKDLQRLMSELSEGESCPREALLRVLGESGSHLYAVLDGDRIVACASLCVFHSPTGAKASIEDVVVSSDYRGRHLGRMLMEFVLEQARSFAPIELHLTSRPCREAANNLYRSLGFRIKETNCYRLQL